MTAQILNQLSRELAFWAAWIIIPFLVEFLPGMYSFVRVLISRLKKKEKKELEFYPQVSIIVPVYNSYNTLKKCIDMIFESNYPKEKIEVLLIDNGSSDESYQIFVDTQNEYTESRLWWLDASQGKSKALNKAIFNATGQYLISIDSDGFLDKDAIKNMITKFEYNNDIDCMTGTVLIDKDLIEETKNPFLKIFRRCEFMEYCFSFLVGRHFQSMTNSLFTVAGAFTAYRVSVIGKTQLYNSMTVGEDTHLTFQIRYFAKGKLSMCEDSIMYVDPIDSVNKLYTQRQRWQRGELEVASLFLKEKVKSSKSIFNDFAIRTLLFDHTFAISRLIWMFVMIYMIFLDYPLKMVILSNVLLYVMFVILQFVYYIDVKLYFRKDKENKKYINRLWYAIVLMPIYNMIVFWFRICGIINSLKVDATWRTKTLEEEAQETAEIFRKTFEKPIKFINKIKKNVIKKER